MGRRGGHPKGPHGGPASPDKVSRRRAGAGRPGCSGGETGFPAWGAFRRRGGSEWREGRQELGVETVNRPLAGSGVSGQWAQEGSGVCGFRVGSPLGTTAGKAWDAGSGDMQAAGGSLQWREGRGGCLWARAAPSPGAGASLIPGTSSREPSASPPGAPRARAFPRVRACVQRAGGSLCRRALCCPPSTRGLGGSGARRDQLLTWPSENFLSVN